MYGIILTEKISSWIGYARAAQQLIERYAMIEQNYLAVEASYRGKKEKLDALLAKQAATPGGRGGAQAAAQQELEQAVKAVCSL